MLTHPELTTIHFSPYADGAAPRLNDPHGIVQLLEDAGGSAPSVHWMVCLGGGESCAIDVSPFADENAPYPSHDWDRAIA
jgi:hypothetical protein